MEKINATEENVVILGDVKFVIEKNKEGVVIINSYTVEDKPRHLDMFYNVILEDKTFENIKNLYELLKIYNTIIKNTRSQNDIELSIDYNDLDKFFCHRTYLDDINFNIEDINNINSIFEEKIKEYNFTSFSKDKIQGYYKTIYRSEKNKKIYIFFKGPAIGLYRGISITSKNIDNTEISVLNHIESILAELYYGIRKAVYYKNHFCYELFENLDNISKITHKELMDNIDFINKNSEILDAIKHSYVYDTDTVILSCSRISKSYNCQRDDLNKYKMEFYEEFKNEIFKLAILGKYIYKYFPYSKLLEDMFYNQYKYSLKECDIELNKVIYLLELVKDTNVESCKDGKISFSITDILGKKISKDFHIEDTSEKNILYMKVKYTLSQYRITSSKCREVFKTFPSNIDELFDLLKNTDLKSVLID